MGFAHSFKFKKMAIVETVRQLVGPLLAEKGFELIKVDFLKSKGKYRLILTVDKLAGDVDVEELANINNDVGLALDQQEIIKGRYDLEVSSPGLERPLIKLSDYERFKEKKAHVVLFKPVEGQISLTGRIKSIREDAIDLKVKGKTIPVNFNNIKKAHLVYDIREDLK